MSDHALASKSECPTAKMWPNESTTFHLPGYLFRVELKILGAVSVGRSVGLSVTHSFDDPHVAPIDLLGLVC